ncbi:MAG: AAA family ATPase [Chloroflexota bacterium]|nr:AAA family ATPase [Chloroflexota bacterium]
MLNYGVKSGPDGRHTAGFPADSRAGAKEMYRSFTIKNFRCFDELTVEGMGRINLIAGKNNVGKTALLEALWVHHGKVNPDLCSRIESFRGLEQLNPERFLANIFYSFDRRLSIVLSAEGSWQDTPRDLTMWIEDPSSFEIPLRDTEGSHLDTQTSASRILRSSDVVVMEYSTASEVPIRSKGRLVERQPDHRTREVGIEMFYQEGQPSNGHPTGVLLTGRRPSVSNEDVKRFSDLEVQNSQNSIVEILQEVEPKLKRLAVVSIGVTPTIYAETGIGRLIPLQLLGDGMSRIFSFALAIASAPGGIVLVDEIENGIHHSVMEKVWKAIGAFARSYDVQLFATTHSYECISAAYRAFEADEEDELRLFRIEKNGQGEYKAVKFDRERLKSVLDFNMEVI